MLAIGDVAPRLADRLRQGCAGLRGVAGEELLIALGRTDQLPWVDGVQYIAPDPHSPRLWFGVHVQPTVPVPWLADRMAPGKWLLWQDLAVRLDSAGPIDISRLPE